MQRHVTRVTSVMCIRPLANASMNNFVIRKEDGDLSNESLLKFVYTSV